MKVDEYAKTCQVNKNFWKKKLKNKSGENRRSKNILRKPLRRLIIPTAPVECGDDRTMARILPDARLGVVIKNNE